MSEDESNSDEEAVFRVSAGSDPLSLATAISKTISVSSTVSARAVGAGAVNQAVKAIAIARVHAKGQGTDIVVRPEFQTIQSRDGDISALVFHCFRG